MKRGSMSCPISKLDREEMELDPFYRRCCLAKYDMVANGVAICGGAIQWHHALTYAGRRIPDKWAILPVCERHHRVQARFRREQKIIILSRVSMQTIKNKYPKIIL